MAARLKASPAGVRAVTAPALTRRAGLAWPRLPAAAELATIAASYAAYSLVRLAIRASRQAAFAHADQLWRSERRLHLTAEPYLNHLAAAHSVFAEAAGYYYGLAHFLVTPLVLAWLYLRRPAAFPRLRSGLVLATAAANVVFWVWPAAPPRFSVPGMTDILVTRDMRGPPAWRHQPGEPVRRHAQPARRLGRLVRSCRDHRYPRLLAPPRLVLSGRHHPGGTGLSQSLPAGCGGRDRRRGPGHAGRHPADGHLLAQATRHGTAHDGRRAVDGRRWAVGRGHHLAIHDGLAPGGFPGAARRLTMVKTRRES
jgi:PAP2 superfamily